MQLQRQSATGLKSSESGVCKARPLAFLLRKFTGDDVLYCILMLAQFLLVWLPPWFPTQDGPSHVYNATILYDLLHGGKEWGEYYSFRLHASPNLGFNLIAYPLLSVVAPYFAEKLFLSLYLILMGIAAPLFIRTFANTPSYSHGVKLLAIPVLFNFTLMMGFYSYVIAVPAFLLAISMAWKIRDRSPIMRIVGYNAAGAIIFYLHLIPFIFYLMALAIFAVVEHRKFATATGSLAKQLLGIAPLLAILENYFSGSTAARMPNDYSYLFSGSRAISLFSDLFTFSTVYFSPWQLLPASVFLFVLLLLLLSLAKDYAKGELECGAEQRAMLLMAGALTFIYIAAPFHLAGGSYFNDRLPWVILLFLLPSLATVNARSNAVVRVGGVAACMLFLCVNVICFWQQSREVALFLGGLPSSCSKGEGVMLYKTVRPAWSKVDVILHAPSYYGIFNGCVDLANYETEFPYFPVRFSNELKNLNLIGPIVRTPSSIDFSRNMVIKWVFGWELKPSDSLHLQKTFDLRLNNCKLTLWCRR